MAISSLVMRRLSLSSMVASIFPTTTLLVTESDAECDAELPLACQDAVFNYQSKHAEHFEHLEVAVYILAGIIRGDRENMRFAKMIHSQLAKAGILAEDGSLNTPGIDANFNRQMILLSVPAQRRLIGLLFFWEEEIQRRRTLLDRMHQFGPDDRRTIQSEVEKEPSKRLSGSSNAAQEPVPVYEAPPAY